MNDSSMILTFGDPTGATVACVFFAALSVVVGFSVYSVMARLFKMRLLTDARPIGVRFGSAVVGVLVALMVFCAVYMSSLAGYYKAELREDHLALHYILPERTVVFSLTGVAEVSRVPTFKGQWRLVIYTPSGQAYESAHASYATVRGAWGTLTQRLPDTGRQRP